MGTCVILSLWATWKWGVVETLRLRAAGLSRAGRQRLAKEGSWRRKVKRLAQGHSADQWQFWKYNSHLMSKSHSLLEENLFFHRELLHSVGSISLLITNHYFPVQKVWIASYPPAGLTWWIPASFQQVARDVCVSSDLKSWWWANKSVPGCLNLGTIYLSMLMHRRYRKTWVTSYQSVK